MASSRSGSEVIRSGSTEWMRNGSMMVWNSMGAGASLPGASSRRAWRSAHPRRAVRPPCCRGCRPDVEVLAEKGEAMDAADVTETDVIAPGISLEELQLATRNHGMPLEALVHDVTPIGLHYLLTHYDIPYVDRAAWRLEEAGLEDDATEVVFTGLDHGIEGEVEQDYARSLPVEDALGDDVLLAYEINGQPLPPQHGFPLRLVVPGWYGMTNVKWLSSIAV